MSEREDIDIDREAWRRRLGDAGAPAARVDKLIRAQARRAAAPRTSRWTLPVSLAAAVVLAVVLAQWQVEDERMHPLVDESQILKQAPDAVTDVIAPAVVEPELPAAEPGALPESSEVPAVPPPVLELPQADVARERDDEALGNVAVTGTHKARAEDPSAVEQETPTTGVTAGRLAAPRPPAAPAPAPKQENVTAAAQRRDEAGADQVKRSPEDWYAEIEALRAAGRDAEASEETRKLQAAYPGWLESRQPSEP